MARVQKLPHLALFALSCAAVPSLVAGDAEIDWRAWRSAPELTWVGNIAVMAVPVAPRAGASAEAAMAAPEGYWAWARQVFTAEELADPFVSGPDAEYAYDGVSNVMKYAFGYAPAEECAEAVGNTTELGGEWFFNYVRPGDVSDVEFRVEASTDLVNWTTEGVTQEMLLANDGAQAWQAQFSGAAGGEVYFRLVAELR